VRASHSINTRPSEISEHNAPPFPRDTAQAMSEENAPEEAVPALTAVTDESSLANVWELITGLLCAADARSVMEIGAFRGELTKRLVELGRGAVVAVDPESPPELIDLAERHPELELVRETSHEALGRLPIPDAVILDGDHNYFTMEGELRLIAERADSFPLLMFHDVGWPLARRDTYHAPQRIPDDYLQPLNPGMGTSSEPSFEDDRPFARVADHEGGPRNGILTAIEDFLDEHFRFALIPAFYGFGAMWHNDAPWAANAERVVAPLDRNPILARVEEQRAKHLLVRAAQARELKQLRA
jgi:hypothetical protein